MVGRENITEIIKKYSNTSGVPREQGKPWHGFKELILVDKVEECTDIISFYFKDKNDEKLVKHKAGQFLPLRIKTDDPKYQGKMRTYSLSMYPNEDIYRISVKKVPNGLISNYLHDKLKVGDTIEAMPPAGLFTLDKANRDKPLVLISAGIGITPLLSMFYESATEFKDITFIQAVQNSTMQPFAYDIKKLTETNNSKSYIFYDDPESGDKEGIDYDYTGFVTKNFIKENLNLDSSFYFCGPPPFMKGINNSLLELGVNKENIHFEFFETHKKF